MTTAVYTKQLTDPRSWETPSFIAEMEDTFNGVFEECRAEFVAGVHKDDF